MRELSLCKQQELIGGNFSWGSFLRGAACGSALAFGVAGGPLGEMAAITACSVLIYDDAK